MHALRAYLEVRADRYESAAEDLDAASRAPRWGSGQYTMFNTVTRAELARVRGDIDAARNAVREPLETDLRAGGEGHRWPLVWLALRIEAEAPAAAADRVAALTEAAARLPATTPPTRAYRTLAAAERTRIDDACAGWSEAIDACRQEGDPYLIAYALLRGAEAGVAAGARETATGALEEVVRLADSLGAAPLLEEARAVARRARLTLEAGASSDQHAPAGADSFGLTPREREVLVLLAAGRSNPQIAKELFISRKTASVHVSNIIGKLHVSSRGEAAALAHRLGLDSAA
jgi:DNA-binding CsgD family transcriptional regulator